MTANVCAIASLTFVHIIVTSELICIINPTQPVGKSINGTRMEQGRCTLDDNSSHIIII